MENENANVKKQSKGLIIGLVVAVVLILAAVIVFVLKPWSTNDVGTVDSLKITKQEYLMLSKFSMNQFLGSIPGNTQTADTYDWKTKVGTETAKDQVKKLTLEKIQEIKIGLVKAKEAGIKLSSTELADIDKAINDIISKKGSRNEAESFTQSTFGISLSEYKDVYKNLSLSQKYLEAEKAKTTVTDDEVKKYYEDNKKQFDKVTVTHILIKTTDANGAAVSAGKKAEAKKKADELLAKVKAGEDIKALALKYSEDKPGVTENKGEYTFGRGQMVAEFEKWAFGDHVAGDAAVVETQFGYHVMQFQKRVITPLAEVKDSLKATVLDSKFYEAFKKNMDAWKKEARFAVKTDETAIAKVDKTLYKY